MKFLELYKEIKEKTNRYNSIKGEKKELEKELIELHKKLLDEIPELKAKTSRNLESLRYNSAMR